MFGKFTQGGNIVRNFMFPGKLCYKALKCRMFVGVNSHMLQMPEGHFLINM